jgi:hypothetical protein
MAIPRVNKQNRVVAASFEKNTWRKSGLVMGSPRDSQGWGRSSAVGMSRVEFSTRENTLGLVCFEWTEMRIKTNRNPAQAALVAHSVLHFLEAKRKDLTELRIRPLFLTHPDH